jgi:hypothetical protein
MNLQPIVLVVVTLCAVGVYLDASKHGIGKKPDGKGPLNMSAGQWGIATLGLWIAAFPLYLINRKKMIAAAQDSPIQSSSRIPKALGLFGAGGIWLAMSVSGVSSHLPYCGQAETTALVETVVKGLDEFKAASATFTSLTEPKETGFNDRNQVRVCAAVLTTSLGTQNVTYRVEWLDRPKAQFQVLLTIP